MVYRVTMYGREPAKVAWKTRTTPTEYLRARNVQHRSRTVDGDNGARGDNDAQGDNDSRGDNSARGDDGARVITVPKVITVAERAWCAGCVCTFTRAVINRRRRYR